MSEGISIGYEYEEKEEEIEERGEKIEEMEGEELYGEEIEEGGGEYEEPQEIEPQLFGGEEDIEEKDIIIEGAEWRVFSDDPKSFEKSRIGMSEFLTTYIDDPKLQRLQEIITRTSRTDEENFKFSLVNYAAMINVDKSLVSSINNIIPKIKKIKYKNALVFMMAYVCISPDKSINEKNVKRVMDYLNKTKLDITTSDIIRYCFLIQNILG